MHTLRYCFSRLFSFFAILFFLGAIVASNTSHAQTLKSLPPDTNQCLNTEIYADRIPFLPCGKESYIGLADLNCEPSEIACHIPQEGVPGGTCFTTEQGREILSSNNNKIKEITMGDGSETGSCGLDVVCWIKRQIVKVVDGVGTRVNEEFVPKDSIPGYVVACANPRHIAVIKDPEFDKDPDAYIITEDNQKNCFCLDPQQTVSGAVAGLCAYTIGTNDSLLVNRLSPHIFTAATPEPSQNLAKDVREEVDAFWKNGRQSWLKDLEDRRLRWKDENRDGIPDGEETGIGNVETPLLDRLIGSETVQKDMISCLSCAKHGGFPTSIGCLPISSPGKFISELVFGIGIGFAGVVTLGGFIYGAVQFQLSQGDQTKIQKARKIITNFLTGLLLIIFSSFLLRFIGVNVLRIYGIQ